MRKYKEYYFSLIYAFFIVFFLGSYESSDFFDDASTGDIIQHLYNLEVTRVLDFIPAVLKFFPSIISGYFLHFLHILSLI